MLHAADFWRKYQNIRKYQNFSKHFENIPQNTISLWGCMGQTATLLEDDRNAISKRNQYFKRLSERVFLTIFGV